MTETYTLYKLIILYMLYKVDFPLTTAQISEFILDNGYTNYFKLQETLSEMLESELLETESTHNRTLYHLTEDGEKTIRFFHTRLSGEIRQDIENFLKEKEYELREEVSVKSDFYRTTRQDYEVVCQIVEEGIPLFDLKLTVPTLAEAEAIAAGWSGHSQEIYTYLMSKLL